MKGRQLLILASRPCPAYSLIRAKMSKFLPFDEALVVAQSLGLANRFGWEQWCKEGMRPPNVPACPNQVYKNHGWQGWGHWLGAGNAKAGAGAARSGGPVTARVGDKRGADAAALGTGELPAASRARRSPAPS